MTAEQFAYWMQGFAELSPTPPTQAQWDSIREHLGLVFNKVTQPLKYDAEQGTEAKEEVGHLDRDIRRIQKEWEEKEQERRRAYGSGYGQWGMREDRIIC